MLIADMQVIIPADKPGEEDFPNRDLDPYIRYFQKILEGLLEDGSGCTIEADQNKKRIRLYIEFDNPRDTSWFLGPKMRVVTAVLELLRFQVAFRHKRYLEIAVRNSRGQIQTVQNKRVPGFEHNPLIELHNHVTGCVDNVDRRNPQGLQKALLASIEIAEEGLEELGYYDGVAE